jgi:hypothetical protein
MTMWFFVVLSLTAQLSVKGDVSPAYDTLAECNATMRVVVKALAKDATLLHVTPCIKITKDAVENGN